MIKNLNIGDRYKKWRNEDYSCAFNLFQISFIFNCFPPTKAIYTPTCQILKKGNNEWIVNLTP